MLWNQKKLGLSLTPIYRFPYPCCVWGYGAKRHFQRYFRYIVAVGFIGGGNRRKSPTCRKSLPIFIT